MVPLERSVPLSKALQAVRSVARRKRLIIRLRAVGHALRTTRCDLYRADGAWLDYGYGKGRYDTSIVGAIYEALEHYVLGASFARETVGRTLRVDEIRQQEQLRYLAPLCHARPSDEKEECGIYETLCGTEKAFFPKHLVSPKLLDERLRILDARGAEVPSHLHLWSRYSNNSGVAAGRTYVEAAIHGALEVLERDTVSRALVSATLGCPQDFTTVDQRSLPPELSRYVALATSEIRSPIHILKLRNRFQLPCYMAFSELSPVAGGNLGFGASLSDTHAVVRAVSEAVQCHQISENFDDHDWSFRYEQKMKGLSVSGFHQKMCSLNLHELTFAIPASAFVESMRNRIDNLDEYLSLIVEAVCKGGSDIFFHSVFACPETMSVVHSLLKDQDYSFMVTEGCLAMPSRQTLNRIGSDCLSSF